MESIEDCEEVILETSGTITVLPREPTPIEISTAAIEERLRRIEGLLKELVSPPAEHGQPSES